jgi:hypothetical protein
MDSSEIKDKSLPSTVSGVFRYIFTHPLEMLVWRWNWKAALISGLMRGSIYLATHIQHGWRAALGAMSVEFIFRVIVSGAFGSLVQAFHRATPAWLATLCVMFMLPGLAHIIEFTLHTLNGDQSKVSAIIVSISFSIISAVFNLFAMRRGAMLVKDEKQQSLWQDFKSFPRIILEFIIFVPRKVYEMIRQEHYFQSIFMTLAISGGIGVIVGILRGKTSWGLITGGSVLGLIILTVIILALLSPRKFRQVEATSEQ